MDNVSYVIVIFQLIRKILKHRVTAKSVMYISVWVEVLRSSTHVVLIDTFFIVTWNLKKFFCLSSKLIFLYDK